MQRKKGRKWTQADLADAVDLSPQQISRYESETDEPKWDMWRKMARALLIEDPGDLAFGAKIRRRRPGGPGGATDEAEDVG
jgi:DNA-binding XRE family transcriptional regulator